MIIEVQAQGLSPRLRLQTHGNQYLGELRASVAQHLGCGPARVRLCMAGEYTCSGIHHHPGHARTRPDFNLPSPPTPAHAQTCCIPAHIFLALLVQPAGTSCLPPCQHTATDSTICLSPAASQAWSSRTTVQP